ncbi:S53 family peptidase [Streptomyces alanosinicus]|uniref:Serine protease n=1 Tax=Streptomyces alanosinicus TaxID=68171 RepID=A0A918YCM5_9ACTN|nr:S53 family peptidase [Streptomyces alanosinicus]GHD98073.1 serine protease [Streptomyces alanosinicus]
MRSNRAKLRAVSMAATLPMVAGALALGIPAAHAADSPARDVLKGTKPFWATAKADKGATSNSAQVNAKVYLAGKNAAGLAAYAKAVSDPSSPLYGKYLSAKKVQTRFGATKAQVAAVKSWLTSAGLKVTAVTTHYVAVSGDVAAAEKAFGAQLHNFAKGSKTYRAPAQAASVPEGLKDAVLTVTGLDNAPHMASHDDTLPPPDAVFRNSGPFSSYFGSRTASTLPDAYGQKIPYAIKGYTGKQLRAAYGAGKYTGKGVRVAITDAYASPTIAFDAGTYAQKNGDAAWKTSQLHQALPDAYTRTTECKAAGWYGEETLDVEAVHAVAPDADVTYVGAASCFDDDLLASLSKVVDNHLADIVSNSWGDVEANQTPDLAAAYDQVFQLGAVQGIGFYFSSGDNGDEVANTGTKQVDTPANSAWVTAVGGTSLAVGKGDKYQWETGWGTQKATLAADGKSWTNFPGAFTSGAGGGTSKTVAQPYYQKGVVPDALAKVNGSTTANRVVPDISAIADPNTGFLVGQTQTFPDGSQQYSEYRIGGTSLAAPTIAAVQALAQEAHGGKALGFANPSIYAKYGKQGVFHDVTDNPTGSGLAVARVDFANGLDAKGGLLYSVRSLGKDSSLSATKGYDDVTGVGSPADGYVASYAPKK